MPHRQLLTPDEEARLRSEARQNPRAAQTRARLALHCWRSGGFQEAIEWIDACLELDPSNVNYYRVRANVLADMQHSAQAVETALRSVEIAPESVMARLLTVNMLLADLQPSRAQKMLDDALELDREHEYLQLIKSLQIRVLNMSRQAEHNPVKWLARKFKKRLRNVVGEDRGPV